MNDFSDEESTQPFADHKHNHFKPLKRQTHCKAIKITVHRVEGQIVDCERLVFTGENCWREAEGFLYVSAFAAPSNGGYDKCDVSITFEDRFVFQTRYDIVHHNTGKFESLATAVKREWQFKAGRSIPSMISHARWQTYIRELHIDPMLWAKRCDQYAVPGLKTDEGVRREQ